MSEQRKIRELMRNPKAMMTFQASGRLPSLPERDRPSPLVLLLLSRTPRELLQIGPITVGPDLGYRCRNIFRNAQQALNWLYPDHINGSGSPADSRRDRGFESRNPKISLDDLAKHAGVPDYIKAR